MDYKYLKKNIILNVTKPPVKLEFEDIIATPLTREDIDADLNAVNSSIEIIQKTRGGTWPSGVLDRDTDLLDLSWHEREFIDRSSFAYAVYSKNSGYIGCFYLYGIGNRTPLNDETNSYEVDASWWVTTAAYREGYYEKLYDALQNWLTTDFQFSKIAYSNKVIPS